MQGMRALSMYSMGYEARVFSVTALQAAHSVVRGMQQRAESELGRMHEQSCSTRCRPTGEDQK